MVPYRDPEQRRAYGRDWMRRNADTARTAMQRWRERHPEAHRAENAAYYARHAERVKRRIASRALSAFRFIHSRPYARRLSGSE